MNACIEEGLRIFPPVPIGLLRIVPKGGSDIDGHMIPEGVSFPRGPGQTEDKVLTIAIRHPSA